jgi:hypothetical protein
MNIIELEDKGLDSSALCSFFFHHHGREVMF